MADTFTAPAAGVVFASDDIGGVQYPRTKISVGADGAASDVSSANPMPVAGTVALDGPTLAALESVTVAGTVALDGPTLAALEAITVTGGATEATLAALNAKFAALVNGRAPVDVPANATTTRAYGYAAGQRITSVAAQTRSTAITASEVMLHASARCFFRVGDVTVVATVGAGSVPLEAGEKFHLRITSGEFISVIRDTADGNLTIMPVA